MNDDFARLVAMDNNYVDQYTATGTAKSLIANRLSYRFDLRGPSMTVDTACSSSLVAVHSGVKFILTGESKMAICGGVNLCLGPGAFIALSKARMASKLGQCHAFSQRADGYVRSEGCGIVILKDAKEALKDNNIIWGYIATSCNSDGRAEHPISNPSKMMQQRLIEKAMQRPQIDMCRIQYIEMHGTGTPVGDPTEVAAVGELIGKARKDNQLTPLLIGSIKSNIGHTESASGVAGIIKTCLMMYKEQYVPSLFSDDPNPVIQFDLLHVCVVNQVQQWPELSSGGRIASLNCFGFGGTNVHATIQKPKHSKKLHSDTMPYITVAFSGKTENSVKLSIQDTLDALDKGYISHLSDLHFTSLYKRNHFRYRQAVVCKASINDLRQTLQKQLQEPKIVKVKAEDQNINTIFVFCGMGTDWDKMGLDIYETVPTFKKIIDDMDEIFFPLAGFKLKECLEGEKDLKNPIYGQPAIFAVQVGLVTMLRESGVKEDVIVGHSVGEVAAAYASSSLSLRSAVNVIYQRSRFLGNVQDGAMMVVEGLSLAEVETFIRECGQVDHVSIAAYNCHDAFTLSGQNETINMIHEKMMKKNLKMLRKLDVTVPFHSKFMGTVVNQLKLNLQQVDLAVGTEMEKCKHISTVTCTDDTTQFLKCEYWGENVLQPVKFDQAFKKALQSNVTNVVVEVGPRAPLRRYIESITSFESTKLKHITLMIKDSGTFHFLSAIKKIFEAGKTFQAPKNMPCAISWPKYGHDKKLLQLLPQKAVGFLENVTEDDFDHMFVSQNTDKQNCISNINQDTASFIFDHIVDEQIIVPGTTYVEMAAASAVLGVEKNLFRKGKTLAISIFFKQPCVIAQHDSEIQLKTTIFPISVNEVTHWEYDITTTNIIHATGHMSVSHQNFDWKHNISLIKSRCNKHFQKDKLYETLKEYKFSHGPRLQCIQSGQQNQYEILAEVAIADENYDKYILHPVMLDSILQLSVLLPTNYKVDSSAQILPLGIQDVVIQCSPPQKAYVYISKVERSENVLKVNAEIITADGNPCVKCNGIKIGVIGKASILDMSDAIFCPSWKILEPTKDQKYSGIVKCMLVSNYRPSTIDLMAKSGLADYTLDINHIIKNEEDLGDKFPSEIKECTNIVYAFTSSNNVNQLCENSEGEQISQTLTDICYTLLRIVRFVQQQYPKQIQISVLTSQVYNILEGEDCTENRFDGLLGYALWGMMRTVIAETPFQRFSSIDVSDHTKETLDMMYSMLKAMETTNEVSIKNGVAKFCQFISMPAIKEKRILRTSSHDTVSVLADHRADYYCKIATCLERSHQLDRKKQTLIVEKAYVLKPSAAFYSDQSSDCYYSRRQQLQCIGTTGRYKGNQNVHVIELLPVRNKVDVHNLSVIPRSEFPSDLPSAPLWIFSWKLVSQSNLATTSKNVCIANYKQNTPWASTILEVCLLKRFQGSNVAKANYFIVADNKHDLRCLLVDIEQHYLETLSVLTWSNKSKHEIRKYLETEYSQTNVNILCLQESFENSVSLKKDIEKFRKWLKSTDRQLLKNSIDKVNLDVREQAIRLIHISSIDKLLNDCVLELQSSPTSQFHVPVTDSSTHIKDAGYLVYGGSKGLGWEIVLYLAANGAGKIGIVSRNGLSSEMKRQVEHLEKKHKCRILELKADISNIEQLLQAKYIYAHEEPKIPLMGIFIGSVVLSDATIANMTREKFQCVQNPKVTGIWNVHKLYKDETLDFFIAQSSLASMLGNPGQTNYAAANAFVDIFMCYRRKQFKVGQSICWGALDLGLLADQSKKAKVMSLGLGVMNSDEITECLHHSLTFNPTLISYAKFNWGTFIKRTSSSKTFTKYFEELFHRKGHFLKISDYSNISDRQKMASEKTFLVTLLKTELMMDDEENIDGNETLISLGADSQNAAVIYAAILDTFGKVSGLSLVTILQMKVNDLQSLIDNTPILVYSN